MNGIRTNRVMRMVLGLMTGVMAGQGTCDDRASMAGIWQFVSCERHGTEMTADELGGGTIVFAGELMTVNLKGRSATYVYILKPEQNPKGIDVQVAGKTGVGAYTLEGDTLKIVHGEVGDDRPRGFGSTEGTENTLTVLRRMPDSEHRSILDLVEQVKRADYEGDRAALRKLHEALAPFAASETYGDKVLYWQGFALWRRAINGFNETVDRAEQEADLERAIRDFEAAFAANPEFLDARVGIIGCTGLLLYLDYQPGGEQGKFGNEALAKERIAQLVGHAKGITEKTPDHPRFLWVQGPNHMARGDAAKAMELYERAEKSLEASYGPGIDPLTPMWGEPELLMSKAYTLLHQPDRDVAGAEESARAALAIVPHWHYVKDILLPQILEAKVKATQQKE